MRTKKSYLIMLISSCILISSAVTYAVITKDDSAAAGAQQEKISSIHNFDPFLWDPIREMESYHKQMKKIMGDFDFKPDFDYSPELSLEQLEKIYLIKVDLPGLDKHSINVEIENNLLTISGERKEYKSTENSEGYYHSEQSYGAFKRVIALPDDITGDKAEANYTNGVLEITIPRKEAEHKSNKLKVPVN